MSLSKPELASEDVILSLKVSRLTFYIQETPYSCYITIRKRFASHSNHDDTSTHVSEIIKSKGNCELVNFNMVYRSVNRQPYYKNHYFLILFQ